MAERKPRGTSVKSQKPAVEVKAPEPRRPATSYNKRNQSNKEPVAPKPAMDPEAREKQLVNLAINLAEKQLLDGTASPSVINHFLKIASTREVIEKEILEKQSKLIEAKTSSIEQGKDSERLAREAIDAMKNYNAGR